MEDVIIYEDEQMTVTVAWQLDYYLKNIFVPSIHLSDKHFKSLLPFLSARLPQDDKYKISYWGRAPIFQFNRFIHFESPFDIFMDGQAFISSQSYDISEDPKKIEEDLDELYYQNRGRFIFHIFYEKIHEIQGFFAYVDDSTLQIFIMFWGYIPPTEEDINIESV